MKKIVIYGTNMLAQQLKQLLDIEHCGKVEAFVADKDYIKDETIEGLPVQPFEDIDRLYPKESYQILNAFGYGNMNRVREEKYRICKEKGYDLFTYISKDALVYTKDIGEGTLVAPGCIISPKTKIGIGNWLEFGVFVGHDTVVKDFNFFAVNTTIGGTIKVGSNCFFGIDSAVMPSADVGDGTLLAARATLMETSRENQVVFPAKSIVWHGKSGDIKIP